MYAISHEDTQNLIVTSRPEEETSDNHTKDYKHISKKGLPELLETEISKNLHYEQMKEGQKSMQDIWDQDQEKFKASDYFI